MSMSVLLDDDGHSDIIYNLFEQRGEVEGEAHAQKANLLSEDEEIKTRLENV